MRQGRNHGQGVQGHISLDVRDSTPDWSAFLADRAPQGSPNVLVVLYDDTGCAAWSPYGGRINMPTLQRLADNGLTYSQWHTTALCSPTRSTFLTGRNHHQNGFASISESSTGFPGYSSHIPPENATMATVLRDAGWSTFWVGKNHNVPVDEWTMGASKRNWPLGQGYDRFYGFIGGETNNWYPDLAEDNHYIDQPYLPEDGYHLSRDLADQALRFICDAKQSEPDKPWYLWFCPGADHAPHHAPAEYIARAGGDPGRQNHVLDLLVGDDEGQHPEGVDRPVEQGDQHRQGAGQVGPDRGHELGDQPDPEAEGERVGHPDQGQEQGGGRGRAAGQQGPGVHVAAGALDGQVPHAQGDLLAAGRQHRADRPP